MPETFGPTGGNDSFDEFLARLLAAQRTGDQQRVRAFGRPVDITRLLSRRTHELLQHTAEYAVAQGQREIDALHILHVLVRTEPFDAVVRSAGVDPGDSPRRSSSACRWRTSRWPSRPAARH